MDNQRAFLKNIRTALGQPPDVERPKRMYPDLFASPYTAELLDTIHNRSEKELNQLVDILHKRCKALNTNTYTVCSLDEARSVIVELIRSKEAEFSHTKHIILHDHPDLAALLLWKRFTRESVTIHTSFSSDQQVREKTIASFIGITAPIIGVADTGTVIELTKPGCPRSTSLVPSIHIALLRRENLVADMKEAYALLREKKHLDSFIFISGPSRTADIEAHLVHGAHGPCEVHLIVLSEQIGEENSKDSGGVTSEEMMEEFPVPGSSEENEATSLTVQNEQTEL